MHMRRMVEPTTREGAPDAKRTKGADTTQRSSFIQPTPHCAWVCSYNAQVGRKMEDKLAMSLDDMISSSPGKGKGKGKGKGGGKGAGGAIRKPGAGKGARAAAAPYSRPGKGAGQTLSEITQQKAGPAPGSAPITLSTGTVLRAGNLDFGVTSDDLTELFGNFGDLKKVEVIAKPDGSSRGFAFITFKRKADAETALSTYNGAVLDGKAMKITMQTNKTASAFSAVAAAGAAAVQVVTGGKGTRIVSVEGGGGKGGGRGRGGGKGGKGAAVADGDEAPSKGKGKGRGKGKGGGKGGKGGGAPPSMDDLDADLDAYRASA